MKKQKETRPEPPSKVGPAALSRVFTPRYILLAIALLAAICVYFPALSAGWFYDDSDYVINDPRLNHMELFSPTHWSAPPPPLENALRPEFILPGYDKPMIADRYLWHFSFALERRLFGINPVAAHTINLLLHLCAIAALYFALSRLLRLYLKEDSLGKANDSRWEMLPALAALIFAVHPWASEPVCYVSARNGSMGALFTLLGIAAWAHALQRGISLKMRMACIATSAALAAAAYASKENFIVAPATYVLVVLPLILRRLWSWSRGGTLAIGIGGLAMLALLAWLGIQFSDRARGLLYQALDGYGWHYLYEIQSPLMLQTFADQVPCRRISLESNHPGWPSAACAFALAANALLIIGSTIGAVRRPLLLGIAWFYLCALPTNSFLPRPDFLAMRNFYLPTAGIATLAAGSIIFVWPAQGLLPRRRNLVAAAASVTILFWAASTFVWASGFANPERVWERSSIVAPDHASVRMNYASAILKRSAIRGMTSEIAAKAQVELNAALKAEDSPTMALHSPRPRSVRRAIAHRTLGSLCLFNRRLDEADQHFAQSFAEQPLVQTWATWAESRFTRKQYDKVSELVVIAEQRWPLDWWTSALRGLNRAAASAAVNLSGPVLQDLESAEKAPDSTSPELRSLQARALFAYCQAPAARPQLDSLKARLKNLGVARNDLARLDQMIRR